LLYQLHHFGWILLLRFADQQMKVLGHDNVSQHHETTALARFFQDAQEQIATTSGIQPRYSVNSNYR